MTRVVMQADAGVPVACSDCDWEGTSDDIDTEEMQNEGEALGISGFDDRVAPGEICPVGECPECGSLVHYKDESAPEYCNQRRLYEAQKENEALRNALRHIQAYCDTQCAAMSDDGALWAQCSSFAREALITDNGGTVAKAEPSGGWFYIARLCNEGNDLFHSDIFYSGDGPSTPEIVAESARGIFEAEAYDMDEEGVAILIDGPFPLTAWNDARRFPARIDEEGGEA